MSKITAKSTLGRLVPVAIVLALVAAAPADVVVRVNQIGFTPGARKRAMIMSSSDLRDSRFSVLRSDGSVAFEYKLPSSAGPWNARYRFIYQADFSALRETGLFRVQISGLSRAESPPFRIGSGGALYLPLLRNCLLFFQAQRDGPDVIGSVLGRKPSHLADEQAYVYEAPGPRGLKDGLKQIAGPMDVSGGWFDAGDYLKFVQTASYVTGMMLIAIREYPGMMGRGGAVDFTGEARHGLEWLMKMWDGHTKTLYIQVGIGDGNDSIRGDHDMWRLPEADDRLNDNPGSADFFVKHRPVFAAGAAGSAISPNLAGRMAAALALGADVFRKADAKFSNRLDQAAYEIFNLARTQDVDVLVTAYPHEFYPETQWRDDMQWGEVELAKAPVWQARKSSLNLFDKAAHWAAEYRKSDDHDSLNLYDVSALADYEYCNAVTASESAESEKKNMLASMKEQLDSAARRSGRDAFGLGCRYSQGDLVPHVLGLIVEAQFYDELTHSGGFAGFAQKQLDFLLGCNPWGTSFIVGAGTVFPRHLQHQVANLAGSLDGSMPLLLGAVVDGPARGRFTAGDVPDGARPTPWPHGDPFAAFSGAGVRFVDDVSCWQCVEPADDYTIPTSLIFANLAAQ